AGNCRQAGHGAVRIRRGCRGGFFSVRQGARQSGEIRARRDDARAGQGNRHVAEAGSRPRGRRRACGGEKRSGGAPPPTRTKTETPTPCTIRNLQGPPPSPETRCAVFGGTAQRCPGSSR